MIIKFFVECELLPSGGDGDLLVFDWRSDLNNFRLFELETKLFELETKYEIDNYLNSEGAEVERELLTANVGACDVDHDGRNNESDDYVHGEKDLGDMKDDGSDDARSAEEDVDDALVDLVDYGGMYEVEVECVACDVDGDVKEDDWMDGSVDGYAENDVDGATVDWVARDVGDEDDDGVDNQ